MSKNESRIDLSEPIFFLIFVVSPLILVGIFVFAFLSNSLLVIAFALPTVIVILIWCYVDARVKPGLVRGGAKLVVVMLIFYFVMVLLLMSFGPFWMPQFIQASFTWAFTATFLGTLTSLLCERFLQSKLESGRLFRPASESKSSFDKRAARGVKPH
jgi:hypothetical protein